MTAVWAYRSSLGIRNALTRIARPSTVVRHLQARSRTQHTSAQESKLPRIAQPSFWESIIPPSIRKRVGRGVFGQKKKSNPANYFIWIYIFIGSQAIRILGLKNDHKAYMRKAEVKIALLREVIEKIHRGEEVDVEKALGTGDETQEREWEEALKELESEERLWQKSREKARKAQEKQARHQQDADPVNAPDQDAFAATDSSQSSKAPQAPGFY